MAGATPAIFRKFCNAISGDEDDLADGLSADAPIHPAQRGIVCWVGILPSFCLPDILTRRFSTVMRLWHWKLISVLPKDQLLGQWRECCLIMKNISENGTPNHLLVNPIMDYPLDHFYCYAEMVHNEMQRRGYKSDWLKFNQWMLNGEFSQVSGWRLFQNWHTHRYLVQCLANLEEKHDRGGITDQEWNKVKQIPELNRRYGRAM